jgi:Flp pilus assembly protein TadD
MEKLEPGQGLMVLARIAEKNKNTAEAENNLRKAVELSGGKPGPWMALARLYRQSGRLPEMEDAVVHATDPRQNRPDVLVDAAQLLISAGRDLPGAADLLRRYVSSESKSADVPLFKAYYLLGTVLEKQGDKAGAAEQYRQALALAKDYSAAQVALNRVQKQPGKQG